MVKFLDGPAAGEILQLRRAPIMLRVVRDSRAIGVWDALDQPADVPAEHERIYVYRMVGNAGRYHLCIRGKGKKAGGFYMSAEYVLFDPQPLESDVRDTVQWQSFCDRVKDRVLAMRAAETAPAGSEAKS